MYTILVSALILGLVLCPLWAIYKFFDRRYARRRLDAAGHLNAGRELGKPAQSGGLCVFIKPLPDEVDYIPHIRVTKHRTEAGTESEQCNRGKQS